MHPGIIVVLIPFLSSLVQIPEIAPGTTGRVLAPLAHDPAKFLPGAMSAKLEVGGEGRPRRMVACTRLCLHVGTSAIAHRPTRLLFPQVAMKTNQIGVLYFADTVPLGALLEETGSIEGQAFLAAWKSLPPETQQRLPSAISNVESAKARLHAASIFVLAHRPVGRCYINTKCLVPDRCN